MKMKKKTKNPFNIIQWIGNADLHDVSCVKYRDFNFKTYTQLLHLTAIVQCRENVNDD